MKENRQGRFKTVYLGKYIDGVCRAKAGSSNPMKFQNKTQKKQEDNYMLNKANSNQSPVNRFSNRQSGKINMHTYKNKNNQRSHLQAMKHQALIELKKLTLKQKLHQIQLMVKRTQQLCRIYGYFSVTFAMLTFKFDQEVKILVWIHPDPRSVKPLHPIKKQTQFQCQLVCVQQLKSVIKDLFPNVDIGDDKTFTNMIAYIKSFKIQTENKIKKNMVMKKDSIKTTQSHKNKNDKNKDNYLVISSKTIPTFSNYQKTQEDIADQNSRKTFQINQKNKETSSTLVQSIRSANSIRQKLKFQLNTPSKEAQQSPLVNKNKKKRKPSLSQPKDINLQEQLNSAACQIEITKPNQQEKVTKKQPVLTNSQIRGMKNSMSGRRLMSMSIQIQSQINNLFGGEESMKGSNFYTRNSDLKNLKTSLLSKVAEQFQDIF